MGKLAAVGDDRRKLDRERRLAIGVDVGGTSAKVGAVAPSGRVLREGSIPTAGRGPKPFLEGLGALVASWRGEGLHFAAAGLAIAGDVDAERGLVRFSPNLRRWDRFPLRDALSRRLRLPVAMDNDANLAVWGAWATELGRGPDNVAGVTLGTGVGGGLVLGRKLYRGATGSAGEIGHTRVEVDGEPCHCGQRGCLEAYVGSYAIVRRARRALKAAPRRGAVLRRLCPDASHLEPAHLSAAARAGDALARSVLSETGRYLAVGLSNLVMLVNPEVVLVLGGVSRSGKWLTDPVRRAFAAHPFRTPFGRVRLRLADNPDAGRVGAALYALSEA